MRQSISHLTRLFVALVLLAAGFVTVQPLPAYAAGGSITIVQSGGAAESSGWTKSAGVITATSAVNINASEITTALAAGNLDVRADSITVNSAIVWSNSSRLTLDSAGALNIKANIWASGSAAGLVLNGTYQLAAGSGVSIQLTGASPSLTINSQPYTVVNTKAQLTSLTASSTFVALGRSIALTDTYTDSLITGAFTSVFDGLGNEVTGLKIAKAASGITNLGFFAELRGATVRNLGVTNVTILSSSVSSANQIRVGAIAGSIGNASLTGGQSVTAYTTVLDRVWSSGSIYAKDSGSGSPEPDVQGKYFAGGLVGSVNNGTTLITNAYSSASVGSAGTRSGNLAVGGLVGDSGSNKSGSLAGSNTSGGQRLVIERSYATGTVVEGAYDGYFGTGGLVGVFYGDTNSYVKDSFSWTTIVGSSGSVGGIWGVPADLNQEIYSSYSTFSPLSGGASIPDSTYQNSYSGVTKSTWTSLPPGFSSEVWQITSGSMPTLKGQATPQTALYVKVQAPTNGTYATMSYNIVNGAGAVQDLSTLGLNAPTGTAEYSIPSTVAVGTYSVSYVSGLEPSGTNAADYFLAPYPTPTAVTITSATAAQTVTWSPTNTAVTTNASPLTPNPTASTNGDGAISYSIQSDGGTGCTVNASTGVLTFTAVGDCVVRAYAAGTDSYASAYKDVVFSVTAPLSQTVTWAPTNTETIVSASPLTPSVTATTNGDGAISYSIHSAGDTGCTVNAYTGALSFTAAGSCVVRATAAATATYAAATKDVTFTIIGAQAVTWNPSNTSATTNGSPLTPDEAATSSGPGAVSYAVENAGTTGCTVDSSSGVLTYTAAGSCVVRATAASTTYYTAGFKDVTFTITYPATQTVTWAPTNTSVTTASTTLTPNTLARSSGTGAISYAVQSAGATNCSVDASTGILTFSAPGSCVVRATAGANATYDAAYRDVTFTITLPTQTVTWAPTNTETIVSASPLTPSATATTNGDGAISYNIQSAGGTGCSWNASSGVLTFTAAGTCIVRATAAATANYAAATKDVTFTIGSTTTAVTLELDARVGDPVANAPVLFSSTGLQPGSNWDLVVRSTPQTLASGTTAGTGGLSGTALIPSGLPAGWHTLTLSGTSLRGGLVSKTIWFEVAANGTLLATQSTQPSSDDSTDANRNGALSSTGASVSMYLVFAGMSALFGAALIASRRRIKRR